MNVYTAQVSDWKHLASTNPEIKEIDTTPDCEPGTEWSRDTLPADVEKSMAQTT